MQPIRQATGLDTVKLLCLGALWGSTFLWIEIALTTFSPLTIVAARIAVGAAILLVVSILAGYGAMPDRRTLLRIAVAGACGSAAPFTLIAWGQQHIPSSTAAVLMGAGPFMALFLSHFFTPDDRFTLPKVVGLLIGFAGLVVLIGPEAVFGVSPTLAGQLAVIAATFAYAIGGVIIRRITGVAAPMAAGLMLASSALYMVPIALIVERPWTLTYEAGSVFALLALGIGPTALAHFLRVQLIRSVGVTFVAQVNYLIPVFGILWVWIVLWDIPSLRAWIALAFILAGITVVRAGTRMAAAHARPSV
jgi:drug/metabolite transporter (DMT)-like permease